MTLLISIGEGNKITKVELVHSTEGIAIPTGTYAYNVDNEALCNAILNNYDSCQTPKHNRCLGSRCVLYSA